MVNDTPELRRASNGAPVNLGQLIGRGGEGAVHAVVGAPKLVAKIYAKPPVPAKVEKLRHMTRRNSPELLNAAAWPVDLLIDARGAARGFLMGRISSRKDAHHLYSPKSRRNTFPDADFRFLVRAAANLARAFAQVHAIGNVIGDVNHGNALIGRDGTAVLIDCDSFQVTEHGRTFTCDVGSPLFTAPELQGKPFRGLKRTADHDAFGLAVLLFHLLFQGRHPFAGTHAEEMSVERAIAESRFVYGARAAPLGSGPPPGALSLDVFGEDIARLFERSFAPPGEVPRPAAAEWIEPLVRLENSLVACADRPRHFHPPDAPCCWCEVEARTGARLFDALPASVAQNSEASTVEQMWRDIERVVPPSRDWQMPSRIAELEVRLRRHNQRLNGLVGFVIGLLPIVGLVAFFKFASQASGHLIMAAVVAAFILVPTLQSVWKGRNEKRRKLGQRLKPLTERWRAEISSVGFQKLRERLWEARQDLKRLADARVADLDRLGQRLQGAQRERFLDSFEIEVAQDLQLSADDRARLRAQGIRSAGDAKRQRRRIGKHLSWTSRAELRRWADLCASRFQFDKQDPEFLARARPIEADYERRSGELRDRLKRGPRDLEAKNREILATREQADAKLLKAYKKLRTESE